MLNPKFYLAAVQCGLLILAAGCVPNKPIASTFAAPTPAACPAAADPVAAAAEFAAAAQSLAKAARTQEDWSNVAANWLQAAQQLQSVSSKDPRRIFVQKKIPQYLEAWETAQQKAAWNRSQLPFPTFSSPVLDEQLALYLSYIAAVGVPDVLIVGSSRALQGVDPQQLQQALAVRGKGNLNIFNLGVNGATAQVVDLMLRQILTAEQLPKLIIWADGLRAFNSGRPDRTYSAIASSPGYKQVLAGKRPALPVPPAASPVPCPAASPISLSFKSWLKLLPIEAAIAAETKSPTTDANGFLAFERRFDPATYYQKFPKVSGLYDSDYANFQVGGRQGAALSAVAEFAKAKQIPLVVVNLPLTQDYLDQYRRRYEQEFNRSMQRLAQERGFVYIDLSQQWSGQYDYFFDPSHLNRYGAAAVAQQLAQDSRLPWLQVLQNQAR